ncbi:SCO4226 family nickel-binding protein [Arthrobacter sp. Sr24]
MPEFMDVHNHMQGISAEDLKAAHQADLEAQSEENVIFKNAWADPVTGKVFCLSEAPSAEAVLRVHERTGHAADEIHSITLAV